jgi:hypothetical protein
MADGRVVVARASQHQAGLGVCVGAVLSAEAERSWRKFGCGGAQSPVRIQRTCMLRCHTTNIQANAPIY